MNEDDPADGWFPESVAADYDTPGGANAPEVVAAMADVSRIWPTAVRSLSLPSEPAGSPPRWLRGAWR